LRSAPRNRISRSALSQTDGPAWKSAPHRPCLLSRMETASLPLGISLPLDQVGAAAAAQRPAVSRFSRRRQPAETEAFPAGR
jgi:hypothetical protein